MSRHTASRRFSPVTRYVTLLVLILLGAGNAGARPASALDRAGASAPRAGARFPSATLSRAHAPMGASVPSTARAITTLAGYAGHGHRARPALRAPAGRQPRVSSGLSINQPSLTFGPQKVHTASAPMTLTVTNNTTTTVTITAATGTMEFTATAQGCAGVPVNGTCSIGIVFGPAFSGVRLDTLTVGDNLSPADQQQVALSGSGYVTALVTPLTLTFAAQTFGTTSAPQTVTVTNTGTVPLTVTATTGDANFAPSVAPACANLAPNASCAIAVRFGPNPAGVQDYSVLVISDTDHADQPPAVMLSGQEAPAAGLSSAGLTFGAQPITSTSTQTITVTNAYTATLAVTPTAYVGTDFSLAPHGCASIAPAATCTIAVTFRPIAVGDRSDALLIHDSTGEQPQAVGLSASGVAVTIQPAQLHFGTQLDKTTSGPLTVTLTNYYTATVHVTATLPVTAFTLGPGCTSLPANNSCSLRVTFTPTTTAQYTATLAITDDAGDTPAAIPVDGTGVPFLSVSQSSLAFALQQVGTLSGPQTIGLTNNGKSPINVTARTGTSNFAATLLGCSGLAPGHSCNISVTSSPKAAGPLSDTLTITDGVDNPSPQVALTSSGFVALVNPTFVTFGPQQVGTSSVAQTVAVSNTGNSTISVSASVDNPNFAVTPASNCASLARHTSCTLNVTFAPSAGGTSGYGTLTVHDNVPNDTPSTVRLSGPIVYRAVLGAASLAFGTQPLGSATAQTLLVTNTTGSSMSITASVDDTADFTVQPAGSCSGLGAGQSCAITVTMAPAASGYYNATLTVYDTGGDPAQQVSVTGAAFAAVLSAGSLSFPSVPVGTASTQTVTVTNTGSATLAVTATPAGSAAFSLRPSGSCATLAGHSSCTIAVTFAPTNASSQSGTVTVSDSAGDLPQPISLSGSSSTPPPFTASPSTLAFTQSLLTLSKAQLVTVTNTGAAPITITTSISTTRSASDFTAQPGGSCTGLASGRSCTISVTYLPTTYSSSDGLVVQDNAGDSSVVALNGTGLGVLAGAGRVLDFGNLQAGKSSITQTLALTNTGKTALSVAVVIPNSDPLSGQVYNTSDFRVTPTNCTSRPLPAGGSCTISIVFTPTARGNRQVVMSIIDSSGEPQQQVSLDGESYIVSTSQPFLDFGTVPLGVPVTQTMTLTNNGTIATSVTTAITGGTDATGNFTATASGCATLAPGKTCSIVVTFDTLSSGAHAGTVIIQDTAGDPNQLALVQGTGSGGHRPRFSMRLASGTQIRGGASLPLSLSGLPAGSRDQVTLSLLVYPARPRGRAYGHPVVLYRIGVPVRANRHGRARFYIPIRYAPRTRVRALLVLAVRTRQGTSARAVHVSVYPARRPAAHHRVRRRH